jgi:hypothetical protein
VLTGPPSPVKVGEEVLGIRVIDGVLEADRRTGAARDERGADPRRTSRSKA